MRDNEVHQVFWGGIKIIFLDIRLNLQTVPTMAVACTLF